MTRIMVKSRFHRSLLPEIPDERFAVLPNGVDPGLVPQSSLPRDPDRLIYASAYDRGLQPMLQWGWPLIRERVPNASLDVYSGWQLLDALYGDDPRHLGWKRRLRQLVDQPGIRELGRVGQTALALAKAQAAIHWYGATAQEIDCISVRERAQVGCVPVTTTSGALAEKRYGLRVPGDPRRRQTQEAVAEQVVRLLQSPTELEHLRASGQLIAASESWDHVARCWERVFQGNDPAACAER